MKKFSFYFLPVIVYALIIFYFSSFSGSGTVGTVNVSDKILHIIEYFGLGFLICRALVGYEIRNAFVYAVLFGALYGISDEIHQYFVPGRFFDVFDMMADAVGVFLGSLSLFVLEKIRKKLFV